MPVPAASGSASLSTVNMKKTQMMQRKNTGPRQRCRGPFDRTALFQNARRSGKELPGAVVPDAVFSWSAGCDQPQSLIVCQIIQFYMIDVQHTGLAGGDQVATGIFRDSLQ